MKKFTLSYIVCFSVMFFLNITHGLSIGKVYLFRDYSEWRDGGITIRTLLLGNLIIVFICLLIVFIVTIHRKNTLKFKWLVFIGMISYSLLIPAERVDSIGGFVGGYDIEYISFIESVCRGLFF